MIDPGAGNTQRAKWHRYFQRTIGGSQGEVDAATDAAMAAIARREDQPGVIAAGNAAAKRFREGVRTPVQPTHAMSGNPGYQPGSQTASPTPVNGAALPTNAGVVSGLQQRQEMYGRVYFQVWDFRLQRPDRPPVQVELRARSISGQLANGDVVEIPRGNKPMKLRNLTTNAMIVGRGRKHPILRGIAILVFFIVFCAIAALIITTALNLGH